MYFDLRRRRKGIPNGEHHTIENLVLGSSTEAERRSVGRPTGEEEARVFSYWSHWQQARSRVVKEGEGRKQRHRNNGRMLMLR